MCIGQLMLAQGDDHGAVNSMAEVAELVQGETDSFVRAFALGMMANFAVFRGDFATARPLAEESLAIMRRRGETRWLILPVLNLAAIERATGNFDEADRLSGQISSVIGSVDHPMFAPVLLTMGLNARSEGRTEEAKAYFEQGLEFSLRIGATMPFQVSFESELAHLAREKGELTRAKTIYTEVIGKWRSLNQDAAVANILECLAMIARDEGNSKRAACLLGAAEALRERVQVPIWPYERPPFDALVAALHLELTPAELAAAWERGRATDLNRAIAYAIEDART
jgi:ATP/maltotriose-dependent transcriptional regulator MalT